MISILLATSLCFADKGRMLYIENKSIRLGVDLDKGGSITYLAPTGSPEKNVVNSSDLGRQIQLSFYSGPNPFQPPGAQISEAWKGLGWNPIQTGDYYGNSSKVLEATSSKTKLHVKCIPMHWPLRNVPGECEYDVWLELDGSAVQAHCRLTNKRPDRVQYPAHDQELPAIYVNGPYCHLKTYTGTEPFTGGLLSEIHNRLDLENHWATWLASESWAAQVNDQDWGLGVWNTGTTRFIGGFFGEPGMGGPKDSPTGYIAPIRTEILDHNIVYDFSYTLFLGKLAEIRNFVYRHAKIQELPVWNYKGSRMGWSLGGVMDSGWPIQGELKFAVTNQQAVLTSPEFAVPFAKFKTVVVDAAVTGKGATSYLQWQTALLPGIEITNRQTIPVIPDGKFHTYRIPVQGDPKKSDLLTRLQIFFPGVETSLISARIRSVSLKRN